VLGAPSPPVALLPFVELGLTKGPEGAFLVEQAEQRVASSAEASIAEARATAR
jgi:hypothetical protein